MKFDQSFVRSGMAAPMAHAVCGTTCWSKARPAVCIVSRGSCASRRCVPDPDGVDFRRTVARAVARLKTCWTVVPGRWSEPEVGA